MADVIALPEGTPMKKGQIVETGPLLEIVAAFDLARIRSKIVAVTGASGRGKSTAINYYLRSRYDTILRAGPEHKKASNFMRALAGLPAFFQTRTYTELQLFERLRSAFQYCPGEKIIVIDEAQYLGHEALEYVRHINEELGVGIALVGQTEFLRVIHSDRQRPLCGRVVRFVSTDYALDDFESLARGLGIERSAARAFAHYCRDQGLHRAMEVVSTARKICGDEVEISERALMEAITAGGFDFKGASS